MIRIQNIYYMLAYAFKALQGKAYRSLATEEFENTAELCAAILARGVASQLKRGLGRSYLERTEAMSALRGRIDMAETMRTRSLEHRQLVCTFDELSEDTSMNRILKATMYMLQRADISKARKKELRHLLVFFAEVDDIELAHVNWHLRFDRQNQTYRMLMGICWLATKGLLQTEAAGAHRLLEIFDEQRMCRLYEKFILEYYRREHPELKAAAEQIPWALDDTDVGGGAAEPLAGAETRDAGTLLPVMQSDITLSRGDQVLIIDAKYYAHTTQQQYGVRTLHSHNLYQIFTYVKNRHALQPLAAPPVSGMLLYAATDEAIQPNASFSMSGNTISVRTLDLNLPFSQIRAQLDDIAGAYFATPPTRA